MPRNMSFSLTTDQIRSQKKTVTRRLGWRFLKPGDIINACEKCMGLKKGEKVKKICQIRVKYVRTEALESICFYFPEETAREGFPELSRLGFMSMFCKHNHCDPSTIVTRIEFEYV
jgi:hypothetical protein